MKIMTGKSVRNYALLPCLMAVSELGTASEVKDPEARLRREGELDGSRRTVGWHCDFDPQFLSGRQREGRLCAIRNEVFRCLRYRDTVTGAVFGERKPHCVTRILWMILKHGDEMAVCHGERHIPRP